ncbi:hypothetical protein BST81_22280 [Leptolyngbya sp. 'hensonii']|uniref:thermonuclease family protein n=1 Tax=Leptolyngbya sp. 'hensonii' TaxID=1922337 RepID=UPI0009500D33|nr:thermonuclease family protein [Leptolyngbya sp. 'hensonii']OLP16136.1 hypothetical protein BST81_22280 [Leptolyngbya sp. 'hensonii']
MKIDPYQLPGQALLRWWIPAILLSLIALFLVACQPVSLPKGNLVKVDQVISGQALEIVGGNVDMPLQRVLLLGIEAPDLEQEPWGQQSRDYLAQFLSSPSHGSRQAPSPWLRMETDVQERDSQNRPLIYLWKDGILVNERLVEAGLALAAGRSPNLKYDIRLSRAQEKARLLGVGLWHPDHPMRQTPSEFRLHGLQN